MVPVKYVAGLTESRLWQKFSTVLFSGGSWLSDALRRIMKDDTEEVNYIKAFKVIS